MAYIKRFCSLMLICAILTCSLTAFTQVNAQPTTSAQSAILIDADTREVLLEKNAYSRMGMASTTKIMTALTALRLAKHTDVITVPAEAVGTEGSSVYLCQGEQLSVEQLLYALLLASANDAAVALAVGICGSVEKFSEQMNAYANELGLNDTNFANPHGLYDENHYTTAYDLAIISHVALKNSLLREIFKSYKKELPLGNEPNKRLVVNHNKLLRSYDGAIGMKTGFTKKTGRCLVSAAERDGLTLICVTLNAPDDWRDHTAMLDFGFNGYVRVVFAEVGEFECSLPLVGGVSDNVTLTNTEAIAFTVKKGEKLTPEYTVRSTFRFLYAPVSRGELIGTVTFCLGEREQTSELAVSESVDKQTDRQGFFQKILDFFKRI